MKEVPHMKKLLLTDQTKGTKRSAPRPSYFRFLEQESNGEKESCELFSWGNFDGLKLLK